MACLKEGAHSCWKHAGLPRNCLFAARGCVCLKVCQSSRGPSRRSALLWAHGRHWRYGAKCRNQSRLKSSGSWTIVYHRQKSRFKQLAVPVPCNRDPLCWLSLIYWSLNSPAQAKIRNAGATNPPRAICIITKWDGAFISYLYENLPEWFHRLCSFIYIYI